MRKGREPSNVSEPMSGRPWAIDCEGRGLNQRMKQSVDFLIVVISINEKKLQ